MKTVSRIDPIPRQKKKLRVAAYCRVSTDMDAQLESLEAQKSYYENYIGSRADWVLVGIYYDEGITGTKKDKRPNLLRMMEDCETGKIDFILTKSVSRFSRNTADCLELVRRLMELHIPIYFEKENLNTSEMEGEFLLSTLSSLAESESVSISENSKWSIQNRFQDGTYKLCSAPYGYRWDGKNLVVDPVQAKVVKRIFAEVLAGKGAGTIAADLNDDGIPAQRCDHWTSTSILGMLTNERYVGDTLLQKTFTDALKKSQTTDAVQTAETEKLLKFVEKAEIQEEWNSDLLRQFVDSITVDSRNEIGFVLKCGLTLRERI